MPTPNPLAKIGKKLDDLQKKADKLNSDIAAISAMVAAEMNKAPVEPKQKAAKPASAMADAAPKKRGRPKAAPKPDADQEISAAPKKRGRPSKK